jgi:hypothetical protein
MTVAAVQRCRVCASEVPAGAVRCPNCSAAFGALDPCPCCRAQAGSSPHPELRFVCDVCGGPRVPRRDRSIRYSGREAALLRKADAARKGRAGWRAAVIIAALLVPFTLLILAALFLVFGALAALVIALLILAPLAAFLAFALRRSGARGREIGPALDAAWLTVATDVAQQVPGLTASSLADKLGIEEPQAEELMALLDVNAAVAVGPRLRIDAGPPVRLGASAAGPTEAPPVEEEAALAEQIADRGSARHAPPAGKP